MVKELRLNEFKTLYKTWKTGIPPLDHLLLGLLSWFEQKLLNNRIKTDLDEAIEQWETLQNGLAPTHSSDNVSPVYTESPGDNALGFSEMGLTAPWYDDTYDEK